MVARALDAGADARWATGDEVYGQSPDLRRELEQRGVGYVLAVASSHRVTLGIGTRRADQAAAALPKRAWQSLSAGTGAKGQRLYHWALVDIDRDLPAAGGCWSAATAARVSWRSIAATRPSPSRSKP